MGTPTFMGANVDVGLSKKARMFQKWPWVCRWGEASVGASLRVSRDSEANGGASLYESNG